MQPDWPMRFLVFLTLLLISNVSFGQNPVALEILLVDDTAFTTHESELTEALVSDLRPDLEYKVIKMRPGRYFTNRGFRKALRQRLQSTINENDEIQFLVVGTHGYTRNRNSKPTTELVGLGKIYEDKISDELAFALEPIKNKTSRNLQILLNSCSVFCGTKESASLRGKSLLNFFSATEGGIYGANTKEVSMLFDQPEYLKFKYFLPNLRTLIKSSLVITAIMSTAITAAALQSPDVLQALFNIFPGDAGLAPNLLPLVGRSIALSAPTAVALNTLIAGVTRPLKVFFSSRFLMNRGWYFSYSNGQVSESRRFIKYRDIRAFFSKGPSRCESLFSR